MADGRKTAEALDALAALHREVDAEAGDLSDRLGGRLRCKRGCHDCCADGISVFAIEAERIRREHADLLAAGAPHPEGRCAFLDEEGACRIYASRPYVCRTQGLPLRWEEHDDRGEAVELRDICPLNEPGEPPLVELPARDCWTLGSYEGRLATIQVVWSGAPERVALRDLFEG